MRKEDLGGARESGDVEEVGKMGREEKSEEAKSVVLVDSG